MHKGSFQSFRSSKIENFYSLVSLEKVDDFHLTQADAVDAFARTEASRVFTEPLKRTFKLSKLSSTDYLNFARYFLNLPPATSVGNFEEVKEFSYEVQKCLTPHGLHVSPYLDANANHASSNCPSTYAARQRKHYLLIRTLLLAAQQAGLMVRAEPDTFSLLLGQFSREECRRIFPKHSTKKAFFAQPLEEATTSNYHRTGDPRWTSWTSHRPHDRLVKQSGLT